MEKLNMQSQVSLLEKEKQDNFLELVSTQETFSNFQRSSTNLETKMKTKLDKEHTQIDYYKKYSKKLKEQLERKKRKLKDSEGRVAEKEKIINDLQNVQNALAEHKQRGQEREKALQRAMSNEA